MGDSVLGHGGVLCLLWLEPHVHRLLSHLVVSSLPSSLHTVSKRSQSLYTVPSRVPIIDAAGGYERDCSKDPTCTCRGSKERYTTPAHDRAPYNGSTTWLNKPTGLAMHNQDARGETQVRCSPPWDQATSQHAQRGRDVCGHTCAPG